MVVGSRRPGLRRAPVRTGPAPAAGSSLIEGPPPRASRVALGGSAFVLEGDQVRITAELQWSRRAMRVPISSWAIRNPIPIVLLFMALTIVGLIAYAKTPIKQFPNVTFPIVTVSVTQSGAAPSEMETQVTRPIEDAIAGVADVRHISSQVVAGLVLDHHHRVRAVGQPAEGDRRRAHRRRPGARPPAARRSTLPHGAADQHRRSRRS